MASTKKFLVTVSDSTKPIEVAEPITTTSLYKVLLIQIELLCYYCASNPNGFTEVLLLARIMWGLNGQLKTQKYGDIIRVRGHRPAACI